MSKPGCVILVNGTDLTGRVKALVARVRRKPVPLAKWVRPAHPVPGTASKMSAAAVRVEPSPGDSHALYRAVVGLFDEERVYHFAWNGRNSHRARVAAARLLASDITRLLELGPVYVVGHSHGGNVAMYALRQLQGEVGLDLSGLQIITLSTPFLSVFREGIGAVFWGGVAPLALAAFVTLWKSRASLVSVVSTPRVAFMVAVVAILAWAALVRRRLVRETHGRQIRRDLSLLIGLIAVGALGWAVTRTGYDVMPVGARLGVLVLLAWLMISVFGWLAYGFMWRTKSEGLSRRLDELTMPGLDSGCRVHVVRTVADEAEGFLIVLLLSAWLGLIFTNMSRMFPLVSGDALAKGKRRRTGLVWFLRSAVCALVLVPFVAWNPGNELSLSWVWWVPAFASALVLFGSVLRWLTTAIGLGLMHSPMIWFFGTSVEAVPSGSVPLTQVPLSKEEYRDAYRFTHSSYENYDCIDAVLDVIDPEQQYSRTHRQ